MDILLAFHLSASFAQLLLLFRLLKSEDSFRSQSLLENVQTERSRNVLPDPNRLREIYVSHVNAQNQWFRFYHYTVLVALYHAMFDIWLLVYDNSATKWMIALYIIGTAFRFSDRFFTMPTLTTIALNFLRSKIFMWDGAWTDDKLTKVARYALVFTLGIVPETFVVTMTAAMYYLGSGDCDNYFICLYSWDHWYSMSYTLGLCYYYMNNSFDCGNWVTWLFPIVLMLGAAFQAIIPFVWYEDIVLITILISQYYELFLVQTSYHFLQYHVAEENLL